MKLNRYSFIQNRHCLEISIHLIEDGDMETKVPLFDSLMSHLV